MKVFRSLERTTGPQPARLGRSRHSGKSGYTDQKGLLLIRDGMIEKVEKGESVPPGYRKWDMSGKTIYAGFIDPYLLTGVNSGKLLDLKHDQQHLRATAGLSFIGTPFHPNGPGRKGTGLRSLGVHPEKKGINGFNRMRKNGKTFASMVSRSRTSHPPRESYGEQAHAFSSDKTTRIS